MVSSVGTHPNLFLPPNERSSCCPTHKFGVGRISAMLPDDVVCSSLVRFRTAPYFFPDMNHQEVHDMSNADLLRVLYMVLMEYLCRAGLYFRFNTPFAIQFASDPTVVSDDSVGQVAQPRTPPAYFLCMHKCHKEHCHNSCLSRSQAPHIHVCPCHLQVCDFVLCEQV